MNRPIEIIKDQDSDGVYFYAQFQAVEGRSSNMDILTKNEWDMRTWKTLKGALKYVQTNFPDRQIIQVNC